MSAITSETVGCDLCGSDRSVVLFIASDLRYNIPGEFPVRRCQQCGLVYTSPRPVGDDLARYYPSDYAPHGNVAKQHTGRTGSTMRRLMHGSGVLRWAAARAYNAVSFRAFVPFETPGTVLDVGCGGGRYLSVWQALGWQIAGVEPNSDVAARVRASLGATIYTGLIEEVDLPVGAFDLVTMVHSLEHTLSPSLALRRLRSATKPGGRLLVMVPNFASLERWLCGPTWDALEVPRHLYHFDPKTLRALFAKEGWHITHLSGSAFPNTTLAQIRRALGRASADRGLPMWARALLTPLTLPAALSKTSTNLWALAERTHVPPHSEPSH
ncbi:MAG TPA: class I SAM-dependent methyltransferase [Vicinamibacterales bacterium]